MEHTQSFRFFNRGPSAVVRLVFFSLLSLLLMFVDARYQYLEFARTTLSVPIHALQRLATLPVDLWQQAGAYLVTQGSLVRDHAQLLQQHTVDAAQLQQLQVLQAENEHLRRLLDVQQKAAYPMQLAEIVYVERDRSQALQHTELAAAQPNIVILKLFKVATRIQQYNDRVILHLPSSYPFKQLLWQLTERLYLPKPLRVNSS